MTKLVWRPMAMADRETIMDYIGADNPVAAIDLDDAFEEKAELARQRPTLYRAGRIAGSREVVVRPSQIMVDRIEDETVAVLRVLHAAQQRPRSEYGGDG